MAPRWDRRFNTHSASPETLRSVFDYVEVFWNRERRRSPLGDLSPAEYERSHHPDTR